MADLLKLIAFAFAAAMFSAAINALAQLFGG